MAVIKKGANGPFKGKVGSVIGSSWRKINYIKSLPRTAKIHVATPQQAMQRLKFALLNDFLSVIASVLNVGFVKHLGRATGRNAAFRFNYDHAFTEQGDAITLNFPALQFSDGSLCMAGAEKAWLEADDLCISWNPKTYGMGGAMDDVAHALVYSPAETFFRSNEEINIRQDGAARIKLDGLDRSEGLHIWLFFSDRRQQQVSKTVYIPLSSTDG